MLTEYSISPASKTSPVHPRVPTPSPTLASMVKSAIVDALALILAWKPRLAMLLGWFAWWMFRWLRGA
jgi:hypothetical protein